MREILLAVSRRVVVFRALFIVIVLATSSPVHAQMPKHSPVIGFLGNSATTQGERTVLEAFKQSLRERGWIEGRSLRIEWRWSEGRPERFPELAADLSRLNVDVIVAAGSQGTRAAKEVTGTIPIVFIAVADPVGAGFIVSLARPGGNVTGVTNQFGDLNEKMLQLAREAVPGLHRVGILWNPADPGSTLGFKEAQKLFAAHGIKVTSAPVRPPDDFDEAFDVLSRDRPDFLLVHPSPIVLIHRQRVADFAQRHRIPTGTYNRAMVEDGSIMISYGPNFADLFRDAAVYVDKILRGTHPADLPVEQPTRFDLVISQRVARAIGLALPVALLGRADPVIE